MDLLGEHVRPRLKASERHLAKRLPYLKTRLRFDLPAEIGRGFNTPGNKWYRSAEDKRFELLKGFPLHAFQACALGRYANPPNERAKGIAALSMISPDPPRGITALNSPRVGIQQG